MDRTLLDEGSGTPKDVKDSAARAMEARIETLKIEIEFYRARLKRSKANLDVAQEDYNVSRQRLDGRESELLLLTQGQLILEEL